MPADEPRFVCAASERCQKVCKECFASFVNGNRRDNAGMQVARCYCGLEVPLEEVKFILGPELYAVYDAAMLRQCLAREGSKVVFCPGPDCRNAFFRAEELKGISACRERRCDGCSTSFCGVCGEVWAAEHAKLSCKSFKALLESRDLSLKAWQATMPKKLVKKCPGCKRLTEKNGGCNSHQCTLCGVQFCWRCCQADDCKCEELHASRQARYVRWKARKEAKRLAGGNAPVHVPVVAVAAVGGNNNNVNEPNVPQVVVAPASTTPLPQVGARGGRATRVVKDMDGASVVVIEGGSTVFAHQDFDVVVLRPRVGAGAEMAANEQQQARKRRNGKKKAAALQAELDMQTLSKAQRRKMRQQGKWVKV